ncbi:MAG: glucose-6-phosphate isomerase, partial [Burkholderiales bacterium]|nr:glucose-6-phosphate isomerase [Burkholderiales bacterium]
MLNTAAFSQLLNHYHAINKLSLSELFAQDEERANKYTLNVNGIGLDFSKNNINDETLYHLIHLANESGIVPQIEAMFSGEKINNTENRAVLHTALRAAIDSSKTLPQVYVDGSDVILKIRKVLSKTREFSEKFNNSKNLGYTGKKITNMVNMGIGGSDLGC